MQRLGKICGRLRPCPLLNRPVGHRGFTKKPPYPMKWVSMSGRLVTAAVISTALLYHLSKKKALSLQSEQLADLLIASGARPSNDQDFKLRNQFNFIKKVVERCAPAVVYVEICDPNRTSDNSRNPLVVSNGSGFIVSEDGWILTNAHVVVNRTNDLVQVKLRNGTVYPASVEHADMLLDLALMKITPDEKLTVLPLARPGDVSVGEWVVALGSPLSLSDSASAGVVSCVNRSADELGLQNLKMRFIQTDAPITYGNSGGPLVNLDGEVIGINNLRMTAGISFAIPVEFIQNFLDRIKQDKTEGQRKGQNLIVNDLGATGISMNEAIIENVINKFKFPSKEANRGVLIWMVIVDGPGAKAGLLVGDVITHVNGAEVNTSSEMYHQLAIGSKHTLSLFRNGKSMTLKLAQ